ncbi:MAG: hypothetical protein ACJA1H_002027, partial [Glaciecola sp.]
SESGTSKTKWLMSIPKYLISLFIQNPFFKRTYYASFNDLKARYKSLIQLYQICLEKERGFSMLTRSKSLRVY